MRRMIMIAVAATFAPWLATAGAQHVASAARTPVRFAIIGDRVGSAQPGIYEEIVSEIERLRPDFVVNVGDMIEGYFSDSLQIETAWNEYEAVVAPLSMPFYRTPGNHDIWDDRAERIYRRRVSEPYRSFDRQDLHFVILDTSRWEQSSDLPREQLDWLTRDLAAHRDASLTFVLFHKPFWYNSIAAGAPDTLHTIFKQNGVDAVFNGHFHQYFSHDFDGIRYTAVGSSGGMADNSPLDWDYHFTWVTVDEDGIHIAPVKMGSVRAWDEMTVASRRSIEHIASTGMRVIDTLAVANGVRPVGSVTVRIENQDGLPVIADTLRWETPAGWSVAPKYIAVRVEPGATAIFRFQASCSGDLYPAPQASLRLPYSASDGVDVTQALRLSREAECIRAQQPPVIDGQLDDACWQAPVRDLYATAGGPATTTPSAFFFAYDDTNLYLGAVCDETEFESVRAQAAERDGHVAADDCVGYFFEPRMGSHEIFQIYFNPSGTIFDQRIWQENDALNADPGWNAAAEVATGRSSRAWIVEAEIPLADLHADPAQCKVWRVNFRRKQPRLGIADWQAPIAFDSDTYGRLSFR